MTAKEYLEQARTLDIEIDAEAEQIMRLRVLAEKQTSVLTGMPHGGAGDRFDIVARIVDMEQELDEKIDRLLIFREEIRSSIAGMPNDMHRRLLELRYVNDLSWRQVAEELGLPVSTVRGRLHQRALDEYTIYCICY